MDLQIRDFVNENEICMRQNKIEFLGWFFKIKENKENLINSCWIIFVDYMFYLISKLKMKRKLTWIDKVLFDLRVWFHEHELIDK